MSKKVDALFRLPEPEGPLPANLGNFGFEFSQAFLLSFQVLTKDAPPLDDLRGREAYDRLLGELYQRLIRFLGDIEALGQQASLELGAEAISPLRLGQLGDSAALYNSEFELRPQSTHPINYVGFHEVAPDLRQYHLPKSSISSVQLFIGYLPGMSYDLSGYAVSARQFAAIVETGGHLDVNG